MNRDAESLYILRVAEETGFFYYPDITPENKQYTFDITIEDIMEFGRLAYNHDKPSFVIYDDMDDSDYLRNTKTHKFNPHAPKPHKILHTPSEDVNHIGAHRFWDIGLSIPHGKDIEYCTVVLQNNSAHYTYIQYQLDLDYEDQYEATIQYITKDIMPLFKHDLVHHASMANSDVMKRYVAPDNYTPITTHNGVSSIYSGESIWGLMSSHFMPEQQQYRTEMLSVYYSIWIHRVHQDQLRYYTEKYLDSNEYGTETSSSWISSIINYVGDLFKPIQKTPTYDDWTKTCNSFPDIPTLDEYVTEHKLREQFNNLRTEEIPTKENHQVWDIFDQDSYQVEELLYLADTFNTLSDPKNIPSSKYLVPDILPHLEQIDQVPQARTDISNHLFTYEGLHNPEDATNKCKLREIPETTSEFPPVYTHTFTRWAYEQSKISKVNSFYKPIKDILQSMPPINALGLDAYVRTSYPNLYPVIAHLHECNIVNFNIEPHPQNEFQVYITLINQAIIDEFYQSIHLVELIRFQHLVDQVCANNPTGYAKYIPIVFRQFRYAMLSGINRGLYYPIYDDEDACKYGHLALPWSPLFAFIMMYGNYQPCFGPDCDNMFAIHSMTTTSAADVRSYLDLVYASIKNHPDYQYHSSDQVIIHTSFLSRAASYFTTIELSSNTLDGEPNDYHHILSMLGPQFKKIENIIRIWLNGTKMKHLYYAADASTMIV